MMPVPFPAEEKSPVLVGNDLAWGIPNWNWCPWDCPTSPGQRRTLQLQRALWEAEPKCKVDVCIMADMQNFLYLKHLNMPATSIEKCLYFESELGPSPKSSAKGVLLSSKGHLKHRQKRVMLD